jgi:hypothetical protein
VSESHEAQAGHGNKQLAAAAAAAAGVAIASSPEPTSGPQETPELFDENYGGGHCQACEWIYGRRWLARCVHRTWCRSLSVPAGDPFLGEQLPWLSCMQQDPSLQLFFNLFVLTIQCTDENG